MQYDIDTTALFAASIFAFSFYKIVSSIAIYVITKDKFKTIRQFLDFELYKKRQNCKFTIHIENYYYRFQNLCHTSQKAQKFKIS